MSLPTRVKQAEGSVRPIVFAVDSSYVRPLRVAIRSLERTTRDSAPDLSVIVLHDGVQDADRWSFQGADVQWRQVRLAIRPKVSGWISRAAYYRLLIGDMLPEYDSCLYLDADILVRESLAPLLTQPLTSVPLAAVRDPQNPILRCGDALPGWRELGLSGDREYFNSGVMLLNLEVCRAHRVFERAWEFILTHPEFIRYWDQDGLNWVIGDNWARLARTWNTFPLSAILRLAGERYVAESVMPLATLLADEPGARLLHYAGPAKPWHSDFPEGWPKRLYRAAIATTWQAR